MELANRLPMRSKSLHLSKDRLRNVFMNTSNLSRLCFNLSIPRDIERDVVNATEYYHNSTQPRKVRKLISELDRIGDTALADSVMDCAEPPADPSIIPHHLIPVFQAITKDWAKFGGYYIIVPPARAELFRTKFSVSDQRTEAGKYYALYHEDPNWKSLSRFLYSEGETLAVDIARPYIQTVTDPTLTPPNLMHAHRHITIWDSEYSYDCLDIPKSQHEEIVAKFDGEEAKLQLFTTWLASHPCPTWDHVKELLRELESDGIGREGAADEVEETYIKMTPLKAKQILDASLQDGSLPLGYLKTMAVGVARSGKTLSKKHIFKMKCDPNCSISTGILESPVFAFRSVSLEMINASSSVKGFQPLKFNDINQVLAHKLRMGMLRGRVAEVAEDIVKTASEGSSSSSPSEGIAASSVASPSGDSAASKAVVSAVCDASRDRAEEEEELYKLQVILYFDSGGQPQYHELVPAISHNVSLVQIFIKLNERLDALCIHAFTDEEGKWFREMCSSLLTNEQMVLQLVHTMMCKPLADSNKGIRTMFMIIGTHRDLIDKCNETLAEKNKRLASLLRPALDEVLIMNGEGIIFDVNAMSPDEYDEKRFDLIREKVSDLSVALQRDTPMSSLMLLNDVMRHGEECQKKALSMEECQAIAGRLKMDRQGLQAALFHYNQMSLFMYIPSILPNTVFLDPQMPLDSVNRLVQYSFRVGEGAIPGLTANECRLWKEGVVTSDRLKREEFSSCFVSGLFEVDDALKFFLSLYIVARLNETEFIMPAMLHTVSLQDMKRYIPTTSSHVSSLLLHFHKSRIANGVFCSTHACMRSKYGWTTCYKLDRERMAVPACLFRNAVRLQHPSKSIELTFFHTQKHFEVYLDCPEVELPSICPEVREMLLDAVDSAANAFRYTNSRATIAFQCPCDPDDIHTATLNEPGSNLKCSLTGKFSRCGLTDAQKMWLGPYTAPESKPVSDSAPMSSSHTTHNTTGVSTPSTTGVSTLSSPSRMNEIPKLPELWTLKTTTETMININERVGSKYEPLGLMLLEDEDGAIVDQIVSNCQRQSSDVVNQIMKKWVRGGGKQPVTWKTLTDTLNDIGLTKLASDIEQALCH